MVKPENGFSEAVRARVKELTGQDVGPFTIGDIFPGPGYDNTSFDQRVEAIAQSMVRVANGDCEILYPDTREGFDGNLLTEKLHAPGRAPNLKAL